MALVLQTADQTAFGDESTRRRSTFYVPLSTEDLTSRDDERAADVRNGNEPAVFNPNLSGYSCDWSLNDSIDGSEMLISREKSQLSSDDSNRLKRYGIVLNGSVDIDDSNLEVHANYKRKNSKNLHSSTPIKSPQPADVAAPATTPARHPKTVIIVNSITPVTAVEKSKTLPVKDTQPSSTFPPKNTFILKSTPKISSSINYSSLSDCSPLAATKPMNASPKKSLSFIRRAHSTKLSRNNSLLKSLATKCGVEHSNDSLNSTVYDLSTERLMMYMRSDNCDDLMKELFFRVSPDSSQLEHCGKNKENEHEDEDGMSGKSSFHS